MSLTTDPQDPRLKRDADSESKGQNEVYLVLSEDERKKGFIRPLRRAYKHVICGHETRMGLALCETYARDPYFYGATFCVQCNKHLPVGEFTWVEDGAIVGS